MLITMTTNIEANKSNADRFKTILEDLSENYDPIYYAIKNGKYQIILSFTGEMNSIALSLFKRGINISDKEFDIKAIEHNILLNDSAIQFNRMSLSNEEKITCNTSAAKFFRTETKIKTNQIPSRFQEYTNNYEKKLAKEINDSLQINRYTESSLFSDQSGRKYINKLSHAEIDETTNNYIKILESNSGIQCMPLSVAKSIWINAHTNILYTPITFNMLQENEASSVVLKFKGSTRYDSILMSPDNIWADINTLKHNIGNMIFDGQRFNNKCSVESFRNGSFDIQIDTFTLQATAHFSFMMDINIAFIRSGLDKKYIVTNVTNNKSSKEKNLLGIMKDDMLIFSLSYTDTQITENLKNLHHILEDDVINNKINPQIHLINHEWLEQVDDINPNGITELSRFIKINESDFRKYADLPKMPSLTFFNLDDKVSVKDDEKLEQKISLNK